VVNAGDAFQIEIAHRSIPLTGKTRLTGKLVRTRSFVYK